MTTKLLLLFGLLFFSSVRGQDVDSLMQEISPDFSAAPVPIFQSPKLVLQQTPETQPEYDLTFWIGHRFGDINEGIHSLFGLDWASDIHIGFEYGLTEDLTLGIGRSRFNEAYNAQAKYALFRQVPEKSPVAMTLFLQSSWITREENFEDEFDNQSERISHFFQVILGRKFSPSVSLMLSPGYLARSITFDPNDEEDFFVLGVGGRLRLTKRLSLIADYMLVKGLGRPEDLARDYYNPLGVGLEIQTGGHVFSLNFQNSAYITENNFIPYTHTSWKDGGIRLGFTISRNFYLGPKEDKI